jgi:AcrR family transcriptional regulator
LRVRQRPRPRRPAARRQQLLDAAAWTFARKGYRAASITDIIGRAGVARGTFYLYFDSKEAVFLAIVEAFHDRLKGMLEEPEAAVPLAEHHGRAMLQRTFRRWLELFAANRDAAAVILKEATSIDPRFEKSLARLRELALESFRERFRRFQARGLVNRSLAPDLVAHLQLGMVDELVSAVILREPDADVDRLAGELAAFGWSGIKP